MSKNTHEVRLVRKLNNLVESRYKMSLAEQRILLLLASTVQAGDDDFHPYIFSVATVAELCGLRKDGVYNEVHATIRRLINRVVQINDGGGDYTLTHWVGSAKYFHGEGEFRLTFHPDLRPYFLHLKKTYTSYQLGNVVRLKSKYSVRMYEVLKRYEALGSVTFSIDELKGLLGVEAASHSRPTNFKIHVLEPAREELVKSTDLKFTYKKITERRKIVGFKFFIKPSGIKTANPPIALPPIAPCGAQEDLPFIEDLAAQRSPEEMNIAKVALAEIQENLSAIPSF